MFSVAITPAKPIARRALEMALDLAHPAYDTLYMALAEREGVRVVTADTRLLRQVAGSGYAHLVTRLQAAATD